MSYSAAIDALSEGPPKNIVTVTIPEGRSRAEIAPIVEGAGLTGSYERASVSSPGFNLRKYKAAGAESLEGFLFPATYELKRGASADELVAKQLDAFEEQFATVDLRKAERKNLTPYDVLIIASMVEREASVPEDRPLIASVIYNRLKAGMPLGIDATIRFATGNWTEPLKQSELALASPYNTRTNAGLPPGPIGNPGIESIKAAANPAQTDYLFFVVKPCGEGEHVFSETDAEFQQDVDRYNAERDGAGRAVADRLLTLAGVLGDPVGAQPLARDPQRGVRGARARLALREAAGRRRAVRGDGARAAGVGLPRRERDDPAQGGGARASPTRRATPRARSAPRTR